MTAVSQAAARSSAEGTGDPHGTERVGRRALSVVRSLAPQPRFWVVQALVLAIFISNELFVGGRGTTSSGQVLDLAVEALFLVPILYAALNFGVAGSLFTGAWVTVLMVAGDLAVDLAGVHHLRDAETDLVMIAVVDAVAIFVGWRMAVEQASRRRYRHLFESNAAPILIVGPPALVREANAAARRALGSGRTELQDVPLSALFGADASRLLDGETVIVTGPRHPTAFRAVPSWLDGRRGDGQLQIILENLSEEMRRQHAAAAYARSVVRGQEEERRRVAQELHDGPVQRLIQVCRQLDAVDETPEVPEVVRTGIAEARDLTEHIVTELREILRGLRPPALEHLGLVPTLRRQLEELRRRTGVETSFVQAGPVRRFDAETEVAIFRIGQEALNNVERHAQASSVWVNLRFEPGSVTLRVRDDGVGFVEATVDADGRSPMTDRTGKRLSVPLGLRGMAERAELVGGTLRIRTAPGEGTEVHAVVPVPRAALAAQGAQTGP